MSDQAQADSHSDSLCSSQVRGGRHLLVLSSAGKPIFSLQHGDETSVADLAALVAAIVSFVQRGGDEPQEPMGICPSHLAKVGQAQTPQHRP